MMYLLVSSDINFRGLINKKLNFLNFLLGPFLLILVVAFLNESEKNF